jgi:ABC-type nitrate/sulfonate/bicarbonate transport system substrate-binding protein
MKDPIQNRRDFLRRSGIMAAGGLVYSVLGCPESIAQPSSAARRFDISIINAGGNSSLCLQELIKRLGYLEELGINATTINVADSAKIISGLVAGDTDLCMLAGFGQAFPAIARGAKLKILAGANTLAPDSLFSAKPNVKTLKDLEGKVIGTGAMGAALHQITIALLQKKGIDTNKVTFVNVGNTSDILKAVVAGTIDAGTVNVDAYDVRDKYNVHPVADFFVDLAEYPFQGTFASENAIKNKREAIVRTLAAHAKLYRFISSPGSKDAYVAAYVAATNGSPGAGESQWMFIQNYKPYAMDLVIPDSNMRYIQEINIKTGVQKAVLPGKDVADMSLAEEALKLL